MTAYRLHVETRGGVCDLGRVVGVLALLELTPASLVAVGDPRRLQIDIRIEGDPRLCELCISRIRALVAVATATLCEAPQEPRWSAAIATA